MGNVSASLTDWTTLFDGRNLEIKLRSGGILGTVDVNGWSHIAYLSVGEILVHNTGNLSLALWPASRTTANIIRSSRAVLHLVSDSKICELRLSATRRTGINRLTIFDAHVLETVAHSVPYATVRGLIDFELHDPEVTLERWKQQISELRGPALDRP